MGATDHQIRLYTVSEAAQVLRIQPRSVRRRILSKRLLATKPKGAKSWLIPDHELRRQLEQGASTL